MLSVATNLQDVVYYQLRGLKLKELTDTLGNLSFIRARALQVL